jgi:N-acetyl sugar amidotransferase
MANNKSGSKELEVKYGLPKDVVFCKKCVISNQRPTTTLEVKHNQQQKKPTTNFDENGVCDACRWAEMKGSIIDWDAREKELHILLDKHRSKNGSYDVIVPGSGGKDSGYVSHLLKYKYGMRPLTVTWAPHLYTSIGFKNLHNFIHSGFDNILVTPNGAVHRLLTKLAFLNLGHPFQPFIFGQRNIAPKTALQYNVKLVFYGDNVAEYGNNLEENFSPHMDKKLYTSVNIDDPDLYIGGVTIRELKEKHNLNRVDLIPYSSIKPVDAELNKIEFHYMSYYKKWIPQDNYYYVVEHNGFTCNTERTQGSYSKYSSIDDKIDPFHYYLSMIKFGMGRATWDASQEIRTKKITREEGVALVRRYDTEFPEKYFKDFLDYTGVSEEQFCTTVDSFRSPHLWKKEGETWHLRHKVT